jgi:hypothetical protein
MTFEDDLLYLRGDATKDTPTSSPGIVRDHPELGHNGLNEIINSLVNYYLHILWSVALA